MSSQEHDSHLQRWLPQLEIYRMAMGESPMAAVPAITNEPRMALRIHPDTLGDSTKLPIAGILNRITKAKSFVLGIGTVGNIDASVVRSLVADIVDRCCGKTQRKAILVTVRPADSPRAEKMHQSASFREVHWNYLANSKLETKLWHSQLAELPLWKKDFGLIVLDLGDVRLPMMPRVGRLCDGIVVQMLNPSNTRESIQALRSLQKERLPILGAWSVDFSVRELAA
jgi:hypothetical protein